MSNYLADNIRYFLTVKDVTQLELAVALEVDESTVSRWMNGKRPIKSTELIKMAEYFGTTPDQLFRRDLVEKGVAQYIQMEDHNRVLQEQLAEYRNSIAEEKIKIQHIENRLIRLEEKFDRRMDEMLEKLDRIAQRLGYGDTEA